MEENNNRVADCGCRKQSDRYTSFDGIDCDLNARHVMAFIERNMAASEGDQPFWTYFMGKRTPRSGPLPWPSSMVMGLIMTEVLSASAGVLWMAGRGRRRPEVH